MFDDFIKEDLLPAIHFIPFRLLHGLQTQVTYYTYCLQLPLEHLKDDHEVIPILRSLLTDNPPSPGKLGHTTVVYVP